MGSFKYDEAESRKYIAGRRLLGVTEEIWLNIARKYAPRSPPRLILDVGSGTGRFSILLRKAFPATIIGIEPSISMRERAQEENAHPDIQYVAGSAGVIPVEDGKGELAWLSMMIHHVTSMNDCAAELYRALGVGARVILRNTFSGRLNKIPMYKYFPEAQALDEKRLPSIDQVRTNFEGAKFKFIGHEEIIQVIDNSLADHLMRLRTRGCSSLSLISINEFERGLVRIEDAVRDEKKSQPVMESIDILVWEK